LAEICKQYLSKGQQAYIEGRLQTRRWEDKEGVKHSTVEIVANEMMMLGERREVTNHSAGGEEPVVSEEPEVQPREDEFPF
jgi:single-strand DNA-binding protein